jgi:hypothetical protein
MRVACWISKSTDIYAECVILIAVALQQWLHEGASLLGYTYIASVTRPRAGRAGVRITAGARILYLLQNVQIASGAHKAFC